MADFHDFIIGIAGLRVRLLCDYPYTQRLCADFAVDGTEADFSVDTNEREISVERGQYTDNAFSDGYCEGICLYRAIAEKMPSHDGFVFHGAAIDIGGKGVVFAARSGVGKSTHISLLMKNYADKIKIINGDKPIIRRVDGEWRVFSTPWAGKEGWKTNSSAPLSAVVLLERSDSNFIDEVKAEEYFDRIIDQVYLPHGGESQILTFDLLDDLSGKIKFYRLGCNVSDGAAEVSYNKLK
jgi:hypothetical protein